MGINHLLNQTGTIYGQTGRTRSGKAAYSASGTSVKCRFEQLRKTTVNQLGETEPIDGRVFLKAGTAVQIEDKFNFSGTDYRVMQLSPMVDGRGVTRHIELMVQKWVQTA